MTIEKLRSGGALQCFLAGEVGEEGMVEVPIGAALILRAPKAVRSYALLGNLKSCAAFSAISFILSAFLYYFAHSKNAS